MNVFIVGGTGFIGYHSTLEFIKRGHTVSTISLPDIEINDWFPKDVAINYGNIFEYDDNALIELFSGFDALVYAIGPDDRFKPAPPAYNFFHDRLVDACGTIVAAARTAGIKKCVVLNSYFAYFDRINPEIKLAEHHPYVKCRVEQAEQVISEGKDTMDVMVLELPYIFGTMPERTPLWKDILVNMLHKSKIILYPDGGTNMISVEHVAEAVAGAVERGKHAKRYQIGDVNMCWKEMVRIMLTSMNMEKKKIITIPCFLASIYGMVHKIKDKRLGLDSGLDYSLLFRDVMCRNLFFDPSESADELGYGRGGIEDSIKKTITACLE